MLYCEFLEGTGARENEHNFKVYKDMEILYMNSNLEKSEIYAYGKKLIDNSLSESETIIIANTLQEIEGHKEELAFWEEHKAGFDSHYVRLQELKLKNLITMKKEYIRFIKTGKY